MPVKAIKSPNCLIKNLLESGSNAEGVCGAERIRAQHKINFTRSRPYRKNDSCFVEQKNYSVVRRAVGYQCCDTDEQLQLLNQLYEPLDL
jgi:hypothetical protein